MSRRRFHAGFAAAGMMYNQAVMVLSGVLIGRVVGAADYGIANVAKNLFQIALVIAPLGLDLGLQRYLAGERATEPHRRAVLLLLRALTFALASVPALVLVAGLGPWLERHVYRYQDFALVLLVTFAALPFATDGAVTGGAYRGMRQPAPAVFATYVLMPTARVMIVGALFLLGWRLWAIVAATAGAQLLAWAYVFLRARQDFPVSRDALRGSAAGAREVLGFSSAMGVAMVVAMATKSVDVLVLGHFRPSVEVGRYVAVQTLVMLLAVFSSALGQTLAASVREHFEAGDVRGVETVIAGNMRRIALAAAPLFAIILFWGDRIDLVLGPSFDVEWSVVALLATNQLLVALFAFAGFALSMTGRQTTEAVILIFGLAATIGLCLLLVPRFGGAGAAAATLIAVGGVNVLRFAIVRRLLDIHLLRKRTLLAIPVALLSAGAVRLATAGADPETFWSTAGCAIAALGLYFAIGWRGLFSADERRQVLAALPRR